MHLDAGSAPQPPVDARAGGGGDAQGAAACVDLLDEVNHPQGPGTPAQCLDGRVDGVGLRLRYASPLGLPAAGAAGDRGQLVGQDEAAAVAVDAAGVNAQALGEFLRAGARQAERVNDFASPGVMN